MRAKCRVAVLAVSLFASSAYACDPKPGWRPPDPASAFHAASVVLHARVLAQQGSDPSTVQIRTLRVLKGKFEGSLVNTASHLLCGVGQLKVNAEYVFFIPDAKRMFVTHLNQPEGPSAQQILAALEKAGVR